MFLPPKDNDTVGIKLVLISVHSFISVSNTLFQELLYYLCGIMIKCFHLKIFFLKFLTLVS